MEKNRIDIILSKKLKISRKQAQNIIEKKRLYINSILIDKKDKIVTKEQLNTMKIEKLNTIKQKIKYLAVNEHYIIIHKPYGISASRCINTPNDEYVVNEIINEQYSLSPSIRKEEFGLVHRLDKHTEGIMILSRTEQYYNKLIELFKNHKVEKTYLGIVSYDQPKEKEKIIDLNLFYGKDKVSVQNEGIPSKTSYKILKEYKKNNLTFSLIKITPYSGCRHQIRVVLSHLSMAIVGDTLYKGYNFHRLCLYSSKLKIQELSIEQSIYTTTIHDINNLLVHLIN